MDKSASPTFQDGFPDRRPHLFIRPAAADEDRLDAISQLAAVHIDREPSERLATPDVDDSTIKGPNG